MPTIGYNWGILHGNNAVDIADTCGTPVYAAEDGFIIKAIEGGWNDGYGNYVEIEHPAKVQTLYAHLDKVAVPLGKYAEKGTLIGYMGATGDVSGVTGCHLHFEVHGAENPFVK